MTKTTLIVMVILATLTFACYRAEASGFACSGGPCVCNQTPWQIKSLPTVGNRATVSKAAVAGCRHAIASLTASAANPVVGSGILLVNAYVRDGACGSGTIIWTEQLGIVDGHIYDHTNASFPSVQFLDSSNTNHIWGPVSGTAGNSMCIELDTVAPAMFESVSLQGFDIDP